jgi:L-threonylcarbamoyladenylate synthase
MERIRLRSDNLQQTAQKAADVLRTGGVVLYPTDTLYGLGADASSNEAVERIYALKGRDTGKPMHAIVADMNMAAKYADISGMARILESRLPKGKVTFIANKKDGLQSGIARDISTFGFRIPDNEFCIAMSRTFGGPITATSANIAGEESRRAVDEILNQLEHTNIPKYVSMIDLVVDGGELPAREPSTVIDLTHDHPLIVREGAVPAADVWSA